MDRALGFGPRGLGVRLPPGAQFFEKKNYSDIIRVADFPAACRGILVGKFENPRFSSKLEA